MLELILQDFPDYSIARTQFRDELLIIYKDEVAARITWRNINYYLSHYSQDHTLIAYGVSAFLTGYLQQKVDCVRNLLEVPKIDGTGDVIHRNGIHCTWKKKGTDFVKVTN